MIFKKSLVEETRCQREQRCPSDSVKRSDDKFHTNFQRINLSAYFNATVRNSLQPSDLLQAKCYVGAAAEAGEDKKVLWHQTMASATGSIFEPFIVESLGPRTPNSLRILKSIARKATFYIASYPGPIACTEKRAWHTLY